MAYEFLFANNATTTLAESVSATATVLNVASGEGDLFPSPTGGQAFAVTLVDASTGLTNEICYCTSRSGDALTVIRGQEGKSALAWSAGDTCANYITADVMESWLQESDLNGYATESWVEGQGYATETWVEGEGYATETYVEQGIVAGLGLAKYNSDPGYSTLPGGMIIQYGTSASGSEGGGSVSFPIAFPSACISVTISENSAGTTWPGTGSGGEPTVHGLREAPNADSFTTYSMRWTGSSWVGQNGLGFSWIAIGY